MNKKTVNDGISSAYNALADTGIAIENPNTKKMYIKKAYRGQVSSFGAAITMGSLQAAVAFFSDKGSSDVDRDKIAEAILQVLKETGKADKGVKTLWDYVNGKNDNQTKENIINAAISLKLAMNLYELVK